MKKTLLFSMILFGALVHSDELLSGKINDQRIALNCSGKHPGRNIKHNILLLIDREKDTFQESRYCGSFEEVNIVLGSTKDNQFVWYSPSPFVINGYGEKILNLKELEFEYRQTWGTNSNSSIVRKSSWSWSAQCNIIDWEDAESLERELRC